MITNKTIKKAAAPVLAAALLASALCGCGAKKDTDKKADVTVTEAPENGSGKVDDNTGNNENGEDNGADDPAEDVSDAERDIIESLTVGYATLGDVYNDKITELSEKLRELNPDKADRWDSIMNLWVSLNEETAINYDVLPDGLPETDELCIVVLGFQLEADGTMKNELIQRLTVAKASAEKYPNAYVVCTGGGTAAGNPEVTEAGQMAKWLIENGISEDRVIVEDKSITTAQNAIYTFDILEAEHPEVTSLAIVSSDYHIKTGWLLFEAESTLRADAAGEEKVNVISDAAWLAPAGKLSDMFNAGALIELAGDIDTAFEIYYETYDIHDLPDVNDIKNQ